MEEVSYKGTLVAVKIPANDVNIKHIYSHAVYLAKDNSYITAVIENTYLNLSTIHTEHINEVIHLKGKLSDNDFSDFLSKVSRLMKDKRVFLFFHGPEDTNIFLEKEIFENLKEMNG